MTKIIAFSNHKGGVGKTTSCINVGAALNRLGLKILLVDIDPQSNLTQSLGVIETQNNIYGALRGDYDLKPVKILEGFDIVPATIDLSACEVELSNKLDREFFLKDVLESLKKKYDYILIDCPPSMGLLTINAFTACDEILIPLQSEFLATQGLTKIVEVISMIKKRLNPNIKIGGIFLTQYDSRKSLNKTVYEIVKEDLDNYLFETKIRDNVALAEAPAHKLDIFRYSPKCNGAEDYKELANEIIEKI